MEMIVPVLPPNIELTTDTKKMLVDSIKKALQIFQSKGAIEPDVTYDRLVHEPDILFNFIQAYRQNPEWVDNLAVDKQKNPVRDPGTFMICGVTLAQIERLLVLTCGKYYLQEATSQDKTVVSQKVERRMLFFKKVIKTKEEITTYDERKTKEISKHLAFDWQLPLLEAYAEYFNYPQLLELDSDILAIRSHEYLQIVGNYQQADLRKAKASSGDEFTKILNTRPEAIAGIICWNSDMYRFFRNMLSDRCWDFFARDKEYFNIVAGLDKAKARLYGDILIYIASENLTEMDRLNLDKTKVIIAGFRDTLGARLPQVMARPSFAKDILRKIVESFAHMKQDNDQLAIYAELTCKAIAPTIFEWMGEAGYSGGDS